MSICASIRTSLSVPTTRLGSLRLTGLVVAQPAARTATVTAYNQRRRGVVTAGFLRRDCRTTTVDASSVPAGAVLVSAGDDTLRDARPLHRNRVQTDRIVRIEPAVEQIVGQRHR